MPKVSRTNPRNLSYLLIISENGKEVRRCQTHKYGRIMLIVQAELGLKHRSYYLRVSYGKQIDNEGNKVDFINEGNYEDYKELRKAFKAFNEK